MWGASIEGEGRKRKGDYKGALPFIVIIISFAVNYNKGGDFNDY